MHVESKSYVRLLGPLLVAGALAVGCGASDISSGTARSAESIEGGTPASGKAKAERPNPKDEAGAAAVSGVPNLAAGSAADTGIEGNGKGKGKAKLKKGMGKAGAGAGEMDGDESTDEAGDTDADDDSDES
jgi:hypothetical protein